jgi:uncharacterized protein (PEP-CTERM system associated)
MSQDLLPVRVLAGGLLVGGVLVILRTAQADGIQFAPAISLQEVYTDNAGGPNGRQADVITQISPGFGLIESGPWSSMTLNYSPTYNHYDFGASADRIDQNLNGYATITPYEDQLKIDLSVYANEEGATPNSNTPTNNLVIASNNRVLYYLGSIIPHFTQRFGDVATVDAYYRLKSSNVSDQSTYIGPHSSLSSDTLQNDAEIVVGSGDSFGRVSAQLDFDHNVGSGSGQNANSDQDLDFLGLQYHVDSAFAATGTIGYQRIHYDASGASAPFTNEGMVWTVGLRSTPNVDSTLNLSYGLQEGIYVPTIQLTYSLGPRTRISGSYIVRIQNQLEYALGNLQFLTYNPEGMPIDSRTGLPFSLVNQSFGSQNVLFRDKPAQLAIVHQLERSAITLRLVYERRSAVTGPVANDTVASADIAYSRDLSPVMNASIDFGITNNISSGLLATGNTRTNIANATFSLYWLLSKSATAYLNGTIYQPLTKSSILDTVTNQVVIGLRKAL